jgi:hypothetical protein
MRSRGLKLASHVLLALQLMSLSHLLLVHHVMCPQHGEILHAPHAQPVTPAERVQALGSPLRRSASGAEPSVQQHHDKCCLCADSNSRAVVFPPSAHSLPSLALAIGLLGHTQRAFHAPVDLILQSPKNSPPTA